MNKSSIKTLGESMYTAYENRNYSEVINYFNEYVKIEHSGVSANFFYMYARSLFYLKDYKNSLKSYQLLKELYPWKHVYFDMGLCNLHLGNLDEAIEHFKKDLEDTPKRIQTYFMLGKSYMLLTDYKRAIINFEIMIQMEPNSFFATRARNSIKAIKDHLFYDNFIDIDYKTYINKKGSLSPGLVVYVSEYKEKYDRPYVIWKIEDDKILGLPLIDYDGAGMAIPYIYKNLIGSKMLKSTVLVFKEEDIIKVIEKLSIGDLNSLVEDAYLRNINESNNSFYNQTFIRNLKKQT